MKDNQVKKLDPVLLIYCDDRGEYCVLGALQNVPDDYEISKGISCAQRFPADAYFNMSNQFKRQIKLADGLTCLGNQMVISPRLKQFIEARRPGNLEFLKVTIFNHKGKPIPEPYYLLNPLTVIDCIDQAKSKLEWNAIDEELICGVYKLVLKSDGIDAEALFFRPKHLEHRIFVQRSFADELRAGGFTGLIFREPLNWMGA